MTTPGTTNREPLLDKARRARAAGDEATAEFWDRQAENPRLCDVLDDGPEAAKGLPDGQIRRLAYDMHHEASMNYWLDADGRPNPDVAPHAGETLTILRERLAQLLSAEPPRPEPQLWRCPHCGREIPEIQRMVASRGQCCPDCYDELSG